MKSPAMVGWTSLVAGGLHCGGRHVLIQDLKSSSRGIKAILEAVRFKHFVLDPQLGLLDRGAQVALQGPALRILRALVGQAGQTVSKQHLMDTVWGHAAVGDNTLQVHVASLRRLLGEDCITTRQGIGYRFVAAIAPQAGIGSAGTTRFSTAITASIGGRLIGRDRLLAKTLAELGRHRLVTLTGCGGVGKTRLMQAAAEQLDASPADEVWLVRLDVTRDPDLVPSLVAAALNIELNGDIPPLVILSRQLAARRGTLLLDNCEHLIEAAASLVQAIVAAAPDVRILATSRAALGCAHERVLPVPPLAVPPDADQGVCIQGRGLRGIASIEMFIDSARAADPDAVITEAELPLVGAICRRLDGLPLAIRIAAAWASTLGLAVLDARLGRSLAGWTDVRVGGGGRHGTLQATFAWSFDLLTEVERMVLARLSVFPRGFSLADAEAILPDPLLSADDVGDALFQLVRQSLVAVVAAAPNEPRSFRLLETVRTFAHERLAAAGEASALSRRHAAAVRLRLEAADLAWETTGDRLWLAEQAPPLADVRVALEYALSKAADATAVATEAAALASASWPLWLEMSLCSEGRRYVEAATQIMPPAIPGAIEGRLRLALGDLLRNAPAAGRLEAEFRRAVALLREAGDRLRLGRALAGLAVALLRNGDSQAAWEPLDEACLILEGSPWRRAYASALQTRFHLLADAGRIDEACAVAEDSAGIFRRLGATRSEFTMRLALAGYYLEWGHAQAAVMAGRALTHDLAGTSHLAMRGYALGNLCASHVAAGGLDDALQAAREAIPLLRTERALDWLFDHLALRLALAGDCDGAALITGFSTQRHQSLGTGRQRAEQQAHERLHEMLRTRRGPAMLAEMARKGARLTEDEALAIALGGAARDAAVHPYGGPALVMMDQRQQSPAV